MSKKVTCYMCEIDWDYELGEALGGNVLYSSVEDLKKNHPHEQCGIVEVEVTLTKIIKHTNFTIKDGGVIGD